jgi:hypothetical protein
MLGGTNSKKQLKGTGMGGANSKLKRKGKKHWAYGKKNENGLGWVHGSWMRVKGMDR